MATLQIILVITLIAGTASANRCLFLDDNNINIINGTSSQESDDTEIVCGKESNFCYALWNINSSTNNNHNQQFLKQGCWEASPSTSSTKTNCLSSNCTAYIKSTTLISSSKTLLHPFFCCCHGDNCNAAVSLETYDTTDDTDQQEFDYNNILEHEELEAAEKHKTVLLFLLVFFIFSAGIISAAFFLHKFFTNKNKHQAANLNHDDEEQEEQAETQLLASQQINNHFKLLQPSLPFAFDVHTLIATGRWGRVHTGRRTTDSTTNTPPPPLLALKVYSPEHREFYENEKFIYECIGLNENIIRYHGYQETEASLILAFDLVDFNLRDFLKAKPISLADVVNISHSIANAVAFIHSGYQELQWTIAHRDLTTKNILIDSRTMRVYLADFGLSLLTRGSKYYYGGKERQAEFCSLAEAGTLRYMAPELLEGAVNLKDCENALKQADVYSLSLILWEVANASHQIRIDATNDLQIDIHSLPFHQETGKDPSLEDIVRLVVQSRTRPGFTNWLDMGLTRGIRDTLNESWDSEPDARLTSLCIVERLQELKLNFKKMTASNRNSMKALETKATLVESPWTGRNPCMERNLLVEYDSSIADSVTTLHTNLSSSTSGHFPNPLEKINNTTQQPTSHTNNPPVMSTTNQPKPIPLILNIIK